MLAESLTKQPPVSSPLSSPREAENERQWQRQLRMSRAFEFVMSLLLLAFGLLFSLIDVHNRAFIFSVYPSRASCHKSALTHGYVVDRANSEHQDPIELDDEFLRARPDYQPGEAT